METSIWSNCHWHTCFPPAGRGNLQLDPLETVITRTFSSAAPALPGISVWALSGMRGESPLQGRGVEWPIHLIPFLPLRSCLSCATGLGLCSWHRECLPGSLSADVLCGSGLFLHEQLSSLILDKQLSAAFPGSLSCPSKVNSVPEMTAVTENERMSSFR